MPANNYSIFQGQILSKDPTNPRQYTVMQIPDGYNMVGVQLPNALKDQSAPLVGSIVLVLQLDDYSAYIISVLREPFSFISSNNQYRGAIPSTGNSSQDIAIGANPIQDGEIFMEATGPGSPTPAGQSIPGFGAHLYLGNNGVAQIESGSMGERLLIGGEGTSDDHEVILSADNGYFESNTGTDNIQSTFNYTTSSITGLVEGLQIATQLSIPTGLSSIETPICELTMDTIGNVVLQNTTFGTGISLSSLKMNPIGVISLTAGTSLSLSGLTISLNGGELPIPQGVARIGDLVSSNAQSDPQFWAMIQAIDTFFTALSAMVAGGSQPVTQLQLGVLGAQALATISAAASSGGPSFPISQGSKIITGSLTVTAGN